MKHLFRLAFFLASGLIIPPVAASDADAEREALARLVHELRLLERLVQRAEANANPDARVRFRYDWLRRDLRQVRDGIRSHIDAPRTQPRLHPPLRGDYRH